MGPTTSGGGAALTAPRLADPYRGGIDMANAIAHDSEIRALRRELAELRALVHEMDADMAKLEWHIEESDDEHKLWRYAIADIMRAVWGPADKQGDDSWQRYIWDRLYP